MCNQWCSWVLRPVWVAQQAASGWAMGWLRGAARNANWMWPRATPRDGNRLLRTQIAHLRLNANAPFPRQKREAAQELLLKR